MEFGTIELAAILWNTTGIIALARKNGELDKGKVPGDYTTTLKAWRTILLGPLSLLSDYFKRSQTQTRNQSQKGS